MIDREYDIKVTIHSYPLTILKTRNLKVALRGEIFFYSEHSPNSGDWHPSGMNEMTEGQYKRACSVLQKITDLLGDIE